MGRPPCCDGTGVKKGPWTPEEDKKLLDYIQMRGDGNWRQLPKLAGLNRCGKSCRLRWANYLRPDIKRGGFSEEEERLIVHLHSELGNKWSVIATNLQGRTDNEIKNHWNTHLRKKLLERGIDPVTHRPRIDLNLLASLPDLLAAANQGNSTGSWDSALRLRAHAAYLARLQLLQGLVQIITNRSPPNLDAMAPFGSAALGNSQFNGLLQLHRQSGGLLNGPLGARDPIPMPEGFSNPGLIPALANNFQSRTGSSLSLDGVCSPELGGNGGGSSAPFINPTANSTPSSVSHSPEITINDQVQDVTSPSPSSVFEPWDGLNLDNLDDNLSWKDILDQISWLDGAA